MKKLFTLMMIAVAVAGCKPESNSDSREMGSKEQESIMQRAIAAVPTYQPSNFLTRGAVDKWMRRMDVPDKTFFIYLMGNNGNHIGYYVGQTRPISSCTLLTPPDRESHYRHSNGRYGVVTSAPSLDGVYGKGGCDSYFFFDAETDAYIEIQGLNFFVSDQPLSIDVDPIEVKAQ